MKVTMKENGYSKKEKQELKKLIKSGEFSELQTKVMFNRGLRTIDEMDYCMNATIEMQHNPDLLPDISVFYEIISEELKNGGHVVNYTDYDDDGCQSAVIWHRGIKAIADYVNSSATFDYYANNRFVEGFGVTVNGIKDLISKYPDVTCIITTDNGIMAFEGIEYAINQGIKVIITDHHEPLIVNGAQKLPSAHAVINPKRKDSKYPFSGLCGGGVIYKCLRGLAIKLNVPVELIDDLLDFVAMATIGDLVPVLDENRIFIKEGLDKIDNEDHLVFELLRERCESHMMSKGLKYTHKVNTDLLGFKYCPMVNALSRMTGAIEGAIDTFISDDEDKIIKGIDALIEMNEVRKEHTEVQVQKGEELLLTDAFPDVIVLWDDSFEEGIVGLVAGNMCNKYNRPAIVFAKHGNVYKGSARSIPGFPLDKVLTEISDILEGFGGHEQAAGVSVAENKIWDFFHAMQKQASKRLKPDDYEKKVCIDTTITPEILSIDLCKELRQMEPFGMDFIKPLFGLAEFYPTAETKNSPLIGKTKETVKLTDNIYKKDVIMFKHPEQIKKVRTMDNPKPIGYPELNIWNKTIWNNGKAHTEVVCTPQFVVEENYLF